MSIKVASKDGVFEPLENVKGVKPGKIYTAFSDEELSDIRETFGCAEDGPFTIDQDDCIDGRRPQRSVVKPAKLFTMHSTLVLKNICALRPEKLDAVLADIRQFFS